MPLGRHKVPFSGKAKKQQLKDKKQRQQHPNLIAGNKNFRTLLFGFNSDNEEPKIQSLNHQPAYKLGKINPNRFNLRFHRESEEELKQKKEDARKALQVPSEDRLEINIDSYFPKELNFPVRPPWNFSMSRIEIDAKENNYFTEYIKKIEQSFEWSDLSYFELNLETWRQLWRVLEMSDIILLITDIRFPALMFPPSLYKYVVKVLRKDLIVVLNKIDLAPAPLVVAWKHYLKNKYPGLHIITFTSFPSYNLRETSSEKKGLQFIRRKGKLKMAAEGAQTLFDACKTIVKGQVDLSSWQQKISEEMTVENEIGEDVVEVGETVHLKYQDTSYIRYKRYEFGVLTIGCIGQPNVGKSSLMNALMGKKVVSVSRTPGHTKHFQTIFLTNTVRLCDCPGLVFPSKVPKSLQVLMGSFPIAQLREPYSSIRFLAESVDLVTLLKIQHPDNEDQWSPMDICDGWAKKKGFYTARAARLDTYRAANHLLRLALEGKIPFSMRPPDYSKSEEQWKKHSEVQRVEWIQAASKSQQVACNLSEDDDSEDGMKEAASGSTSTKSVYSSEEVSQEEETDDDDDDEETLLSRNKFQALNISE